MIPIVYRVESQVKDPGFWPGFVFNEFMRVYNQLLTSSYLLGLQLQPAASILACQDLVKLAPRLVTLARPSVSSSLQVTNRSFTYASPYLWNQLPSSFRQPHSVHCPPGSSHPAHITSSQSPPSLSSPITASTFHSRLKTHLFHNSSIVTLIPSGLPSWILTCTELKGHWRCLF